MKRRGSAIASVLVLLLLISIVGLTAAALGTSQLATASQRTKSSLARSLAEAGLTAACGRILHDTQFGTHHEVITKHFDGLPESVGQVCFDPSLGLPYSVNNLKGTTSVPGWSGASVPLEQVHLIGVGRHAGIERRVEAVLHLPRFPYVLSSSGPLQSNGGLEVFGVRDLAALSGGFDQVPQADQVGGHLVSNGLDLPGLKALSLQGDSMLKGDVQSSGSAQITSSVTVSGEIREHSDPVALPTIDVTQLDPAGQGVVTNIGTPSLTSLPVEGFARRSGNLSISGPLELNGGVLYVDGDLTVTGGISGKGAVIVTGKTHVTGGGQMATDNQAALLSKGDVVIEGTPQARANFTGLIYTEGDFRTNYVNVAGAFVAHKPQANGGSLVQMDNSTMVHIPQMTQVSFSVTTTTTSTSAPGNPLEIAVHLGSAWDPNVPGMAPPPPGYTGGGNVFGLDAQGPGQNGGSAIGGANLGTQAQSTSAFGGNTFGANSSAATTPGPVFGSDLFAPPGLAPNNENGTLRFNPSLATVPAGSTGQAYLDDPDLAWKMVEVTLPSGTYTGMEFLDYARSLMTQSQFDQWRQAYNGRLGSLAVQALMQSPAAPAPARGATPPITQTFTSASNWSVDLSKFIRESDRIRILMWRDR